MFLNFTVYKEHYTVSIDPSRIESYYLEPLLNDYYKVGLYSGKEFKIDKQSFEQLHIHIEWIDKKITEILK